MSRAQGPGLFFQNENLNIHNEGGPVLKKTNTSISKTSHKKVGGNRRALQDLSNSGIVNQNQNLDIRKEGPFVKKTSGSFSKTSQTKAGGNRKALQDLSNSLSVHPDATTKKKTLNRGEIGVTEERFLHNPHQCTAARKAEMDRNIHDAVLLEHGLLEPDMSPLQKETELVPCSSPPKCLELESVPELSISAKADMCSSPIQLDSPSPIVSLYELPELKKSMPRAREAELTFQGQNLVHHNDHNVLEEGFLHDHNKCTEAHRAQMDHDLYIKVLLEHGLTHSQEALEEKETLVTYNSPPRYMNCEEIPKLPMSTIVDFCSSPNQIDSPTFSPSWYELPELVLSVEG